MDWGVESESECGSWAALGVSGTRFGPAAQDEGLGGRSGPTPAPPRTAGSTQPLAEPRHSYFVEALRKNAFGVVRCYRIPRPLGTSYIPNLGP